MPLTTYTAGQVLTAASLNANFSFAATAGPTFAVFNETQANGTDGGTATSGSFIKRVLNTTVTNGITGCSIASSVITLPAGTYLVQAYAPFIQTNGAQLKLRNTTDSTDAIVGTAQKINTSASGMPELTGVFTIAGSKNFELQYRVNATKTIDGLGGAEFFGVGEIYSSITITKTA
jgi:hypothetical protein